MSGQRGRVRNSQRAGKNRGVWLIGAAIVLVISLGTLAWMLTPGQTVATDPAAPGRLAVEQATVDLGRVPFDQLVEARFALGNTGGDIVRLVGAPRVRMLEGC